MKKIIYILSSIILVTTLLSQCKKDNNSDTSTQIEFVSGAKYFTSSSDSVNVGDTLIFKWNITSIPKMKYLLIEDKGATSTSIYNLKTLGNVIVTKVTDTIASSKQNAYSDTFAIKAISSGTSNLRFTITDSLGKVLLRSDITINIKSDINYFTRRVLYMPDSLAKGPAYAKCYFAASTGNTYTYNDLKANPSTLLNSLDIGYYLYGITTTSGTTTTTKLYHAFYSLTSNWYSNNPLVKDSLAGITPSRITYFKNLTSVTQANIRNAADIASAISSIGTAVKDSIISTSITTTQLGFKTAEGKYGILWVTFSSSDSIRFSVKLQK